MPAAMIHLLTARDYDPQGDARYLLGSIAPDHAFDRAFKDTIHLRDVPDRQAALSALREKLDTADSYSLGWLLHLFTDMKWDTSFLADYRAAHEGEENWFRGYHKELHSAGYALYHRYGWADKACSDILAVDLSALPPSLPGDPAQIEEFRSILMEKTRESAPDIHSDAFPVETVERFAAETAAAFRAWMEGEA
ncbi:MAG: hypothetical protein IKN89_03075 [Oscillospiraceae bacterium]|nr:hypothetical protein [Oscillospiraceae bacterium]